jgi:hypothetical protein
MNTDTPTPRTDEWETYCDESYYHLWRVRRKNERGFNDGYHVNNREEATALCDVLNRMDRELAELKDKHARNIIAWGKEVATAIESKAETDRELAEAKFDLQFRRELYALQTKELGEAREQRDRLAEAIITHRAKAFPLNGEDYDLELWQALQSLTTNKNHKP